MNKRKEILAMMKRLPYEKYIWNDLSNALKIKLKINEK